LQSAGDNLKTAVEDLFETVLHKSGTNLKVDVLYHYAIGGMPVTLPVMKTITFEFEQEFPSQLADSIHAWIINNLPEKPGCIIMNVTFFTENLLPMLEIGNIKILQLD
jgi:hypothetical protein